MGDKFDEIVLTLLRYNIEFQQPIIGQLILCVLSSIFSIWTDKKSRKVNVRKVPSGVLLVTEVVTGLRTNIIGGNLKHETRHYLSFLGILTMTVAVSNLLGFLGLRSSTSSLSFNITLVLMIFLTIQYNGIKEGGLDTRLKELTEPMQLLAPLNVIDELTLLISLSMRLFGSVLAGSIIILPVYTMIRGFLSFGVLGYIVISLLYAYFDMLSGLIQTYIFFTLASFFLNEQVSPKEQQVMLTGRKNYGIQ